MRQINIGKLHMSKCCRMGMSRAGNLTRVFSCGENTDEK